MSDACRAGTGGQPRGDGHAWTAHGVRLTPARAFVLDALVRSRRALTAYELLDLLREVGLGNAPPIVYRALGFLVSHGLAHRVERLSAYVACAHVDDCQAGAFLICDDCRRVTEIPIDLAASSLGERARAEGFVVREVSVEVEGLCADCRDARLSE